LDAENKESEQGHHITREAQSYFPRYSLPSIIASTFFQAMVLDYRPRIPGRMSRAPRTKTSSVLYYRTAADEKCTVYGSEERVAVSTMDSRARESVMAVCCIVHSQPVMLVETEWKTGDGDRHRPEKETLDATRPPPPRGHKPK